MAGARLADEILTHMGEFMDDPGLCALACSERMRWDRSSLQRQTRKNEQLQFLQLRGHTECLGTVNVLLGFWAASGFS